MAGWKRTRGPWTKLEGAQPVICTALAHYAFNNQAVAQLQSCHVAQLFSKRDIRWKGCSASPFTSAWAVGTASELGQVCQQDVVVCWCWESRWKNFCWRDLTTSACISVNLTSAVLVIFQKTQRSSTKTESVPSVHCQSSSRKCMCTAVLQWECRSSSLLWM